MNRPFTIDTKFELADIQYRGKSANRINVILQGGATLFLLSSAKTEKAETSKVGLKLIHNIFATKKIVFNKIFHHFILFVFVFAVVVLVI